MNNADPFQTVTIEVSWLVAAAVSGALAALGSLGLVLFRQLFRHLFPEPREAAARLLDALKDPGAWVLTGSKDVLMSDEWALNLHLVDPHGRPILNGITIATLTENSFVRWADARHAFNKKEWAKVEKVASNLLTKKREQEVLDLLSKRA